MKPSPINPTIKPGALLTGIFFGVLVVWAIAVANKPPTPAEIEQAKITAAAADVQRAFTRAKYETGRERIMAGVRMYCRATTPADCRDMRIAAGLDTPD